MRKNEEEQYTKMTHYLCGALFGGLFAAAVCLLLLLFCSFGISKGWLNDGYMIQYTVAACVIGAFAGGRFAVRRCRTRILLLGLGTGLVFFLLLLSVGFILLHDVSLENHGVGLLCASLIGGTFAGFPRGKKKKKQRK